MYKESKMIMKRTSKLFAVALAIILLSSFLACSSNDEILPETIINEIKCSNDVTQFFDNECDKIIKTDTYIDSCIIINSAEQFNSIYSGDKQIPYIDFSKYTLVVGQKSMNSYGWAIDNKILCSNENQLMMSLYISSKTELHAQAFMKLYYWGIYPKLSSEHLIISIFDM